MKALLILLASVLLFADPTYLQSDKQKHFIGSAVIGATASGLARHYGSNKIEAMFIGIGTALLIGIAKEAIDGKGYGTEDIGDVYADTLGAVSGSVISTKFEWRF